MLKNYLVFSAIGLFYSLPAHGDFVGDGSAAFLQCNYSYYSCAASFSSLTPSGPNTQSGQATVGDGEGDYMTVSVSGQQTEVYTPTSFGVDLLMTASVVESGYGIGGGSAELWTEGFPGGFPEGGLTAPTAGQIHITVSGSETGGGFGWSGIGPFWDLYGSGTSPSPIVSGDWAPTDETLTVGPGDYFIQYYVSGAFSTMSDGDWPVDFEISQTDSLSIDFTPSVPEPRWIAVIPAALLLLQFVWRPPHRRSFSVS